jgi:signal transduction histidine kinase
MAELFKVKISRDISPDQRALLEKFAQPVLLVSARGTIQYANPAAAAAFSPDATICGAALDSVLSLSLRIAHHTGGTLTGEIADSSGCRRQVLVTRSELTQEGGSPLCLYTVQDFAYLTHASGQREELLHSVAHELRTPLSSLKTAAGVLREEAGRLAPQEIDRLTESILRTVQRLDTLMGDMLSAGAIQAGRLVVHPLDEALDRLVQEAIEGVSLLIETRQQSVDVRLPTPAPRVLADRRAIGRVLANLITNAIKYGPDHGVITISARPAIHCVEVSVADQGPGIPAEEQAGLFERYYRARPSPQTPGVGLGLAIARGVVEAHGGEIGIESRLGEGTRVWFTLPAAEPLEPE